MDGIAIDQLQNFFGDKPQEILKTLEQLANLQTQQVNALDKLQSFIGQKVDTIVDYQRTVNQKIQDSVSAITETKSNTQSQQTEKKEKTAESELSNIKLVSSSAKTIPSNIKALPVRVVDVTEKQTKQEKRNNIVQNVFAKKNKNSAKKDEGNSITSLISSLFNKSAFSSKKESAQSPFHKEDIDIYIPSETEVKLQNIIGDTIKPFITRLHEDNIEIIELLGRKPEKKEEKKEPWWKKLLLPLMLLGSALGKFITGLPGMLFNIGKTILPLIQKLLGPILPLLLGAGAAVAGIATLISGLFDTGPLKGIKKIFGKGALNFGIKILKNQFAKITKVVSTVAKSMFSEKLFEKFLDTIKNGVGKIFGKIKGFVGKLFGGAFNSLKKMFGGLLEKVGESGIGKAGKGIFGKIFGTLGKFFSKNVLKRIPIIGTIIGISYAWSRFKSGNIMGGIIDLASAFATLVPGVGTALSIGLDVLNAFLDVKAGGSDQKAGTKKISFLAQAGEWIYNKIKDLPILGSMIKMGTAISEGKWGDALSALGQAFRETPLGMIVSYIVDNQEAIAEGASTAMQATGNFIVEAGKWIYDKAKTLPVIGSLIKAGEAIGAGKWGDVLGYLGEAIEPLQYIGSLIANTVAPVAINAGNGITDFFTSIKDSLFRAVLDMVPDIKIGGWSLKGTVAKLLGIDLQASTPPPAPKTETLPPSTPVTVNNAPVNPTKNNIAQKAKENPIINSIAAKEEGGQDYTQNNNTGEVNDMSAADGDEDYDVSEEASNTWAPKPIETATKNTPNINDLNKTLQLQMTYLKSQIEYSKRTSDYTKMLVEKFSTFDGGNKIVNVSSVNSPTHIVSGPGSSSAFRQAYVSGQ